MVIFHSGTPLWPRRSMFNDDELVDLRAPDLQTDKNQDSADFPLQ